MRGGRGGNFVAMLGVFVVLGVALQAVPVSALGINEYPVPAGSAPTHVAAGFGFIWATGIDAGTILKIDPASGALAAVYTIPASGPNGTSPGPCGIVTGLGFVWATTAIGKLVRLDPTTGAMVLFDVPLGLDVRHPDVGFGSVWLTAPFGDAIVRFVPASGTFKLYPLTGTSSPREVAAGAGSVWFTEFGTNKIGRLNPATGTITERTLPTPMARPYGIAFAFGRVWFVETGVRRLGALSPATGAIAEYAMPNPAAAVGFGFVTQGGSFIWYTRSATNVLGRFDPSTGDFKEFAVPTPAAFLHSLRFGFGYVWFAEAGVDQVGRAALSMVVTVARTEPARLCGGHHGPAYANSLYSAYLPELS